MVRSSSSSLVCRYPPSIYATRLVGEVLLAGMDLEAPYRLGGGEATPATLKRTNAGMIPPDGMRIPFIARRGYRRHLNTTNTGMVPPRRHVFTLHSST